MTAEVIRSTPSLACGSDQGITRTNPRNDSPGTTHCKEPDMADCPNIRTCAFFNDKLTNRPATANLMKKSYCNGRYLECARYMVCSVLGSAKVPADLFPSMDSRAREILSPRADRIAPMDLDAWAISGNGERGNQHGPRTTTRFLAGNRGGDRVFRHHGQIHRSAVLMSRFEADLRVVIDACTRFQSWRQFCLSSSALSKALPISMRALNRVRS